PAASMRYVEQDVSHSRVGGALGQLLAIIRTISAHRGGKHGSITVSRLSDAEWGSGSRWRLPIRDKNSRLRNRFGAGEVRWNRFFRLDVVAVKGTADEQGWTKDRITKRGSNALPIRAARYRWEASDAGRASTNPPNHPR